MFKIFNGKENKEAGTICFEVRIPKKIPEKYYEIVASKIDGGDIRHPAIKKCITYVSTNVLSVQIHNRDASFKSR